MRAAEILMMTGGGLFLDRYPGAAALYSVFRLSSTYTGPCVNVRRSTGSPADEDVYFVSNYIDEAELTSFMGSANLFVVTWYDQSGNGRHLSGAYSAAAQPKAGTTGTLNKINGLMSFIWDGSNDALQLSPYIDLNGDYTCLSVVKRTASGVNGVSLSGLEAYTTYHFNNNTIYTRASPGLIASNATDTSSSQMVLSSVFNGTTKKQYKNGVEIASTYSAATSNNRVDYLGRFNTNYASGDCQELILYLSDKSADLPAMINDRKAAFGIV